MLIIFFFLYVGSKSLTVQPRGWALVSASTVGCGTRCSILPLAKTMMEVTVVVSLELSPHVWWEPSMWESRVF